MATNQPTESTKRRDAKVTALESRRASQRRSERSTAFMQELRLRLASALQTTLDSHEVVSLFFQEIQTAVALDGIEYRHCPTESTVVEGKHGKHRATYELRTQNEHFGEIEFSRNRRFNENELFKLESVLDLFIYPIRNALRYQQAVQSALMDPLTEVGNRLALSNTLRHQLELCKRHDRTVSVMMLDIDYFKDINDQYGHEAGDKVLKALAQVTRQSLRDVDGIFRLGGEEFLIILPETDKTCAALVGDRIRKRIAARDFLPGSNFSVTVSIGIAEYQTRMTFDELLRRADQAMYRAKRSGRNQIQTARNLASETSCSADQG